MTDSIMDLNIQMPFTPALSAVQLLSHPTTTTASSSSSPSSFNFSSSAPPSPSSDFHFPSIPTSISMSTLTVMSNVLSYVLLFRMLFTTYIYIAKRNKGLIGPTPAPKLLKSAIIYSIVHPAYLVLHMYLSPMNLQWVASILQAVILLVITLSPADSPGSVTWLYDEYVRPFFLKNAYQIETYMQECRIKWHEFNAHLKELALFSLNRIAVGGLPYLFQVPTADSLIQLHHQKQQQQQQLQQPIKRKPSFTNHPIHNSNHHNNNLIDSSNSLTAVDDDIITSSSPTSRALFCNNSPQSRVDTIVTAFNSQTMMNGNSSSANQFIQPTKIDAPKSRFEDARKLREQFRQGSFVKQKRKTSTK